MSLVMRILQRGVPLQMNLSSARWTLDCSGYEVAGFRPRSSYLILSMTAALGPWPTCLEIHGLLGAPHLSHMPTPSARFVGSQRNPK